MTNWFYFGNDGTKQGPINDYQLKALVKRGVITPDTFIETTSGQQTKAGKINGLPFPTTSASPDSSPGTYGVAGNAASAGSPPSGVIPPILQVPPQLDDPFAASAPPLQSVHVPKSKTGTSQTAKDALTNFKAKPGLNWLLDLKFNLCYVFTFAKGIIQILYVLCLVLTALAILVGPVVNSYPAWRSYGYGKERMAGLYKTERELKSQVREIEKLSEEKLRERAEEEVRKEYAAYRSLLQGKLDELKQKPVQEIRENLTTALKSELTDAQNEIRSTKQYVPSFTVTVAWTVLITLATWIGALLQIFFVRLLCEWLVFMLGWLVDTRQASQHIIAKSTEET